MAKHAKAPLGSTYHYFPEDKQQLASEAGRYTGEWVFCSLRKELENGPAVGLQTFLALWRKIVVDTDFQAGCPVMEAAIVEPSTGQIPPALAAAAEVFEPARVPACRNHAAPRRPGRPGSADRHPYRVLRRGRRGDVPAKRTTEPLDRVAA